MYNAITPPPMTDYLNTRRQVGLDRGVLCKLTGIRVHTMARIELGYRAATPDEHERICFVLEQYKLAAIRSRALLQQAS